MKYLFLPILASLFMISATSFASQNQYYLAILAQHLPDGKYIGKTTQRADCSVESKITRSNGTFAAISLVIREYSTGQAAPYVLSADEAATPIEQSMTSVRVNSLSIVNTHTSPSQTVRKYHLLLKTESPTSRATGLFLNTQYLGLGGIGTHTPAAIDCLNLQMAE